MDYIEIVNASLDYLEVNLQRVVTLDELAEKHYISRYHFYRIFRAITNMTLKEYALGRRLSEAAKELKATSKNVIDIGFEFGFESHEVFTRSFKRVFAVTPSQYRKAGGGLPLLERLVVVERDFKNLNKEIVVDFKLRHYEPIELLGRRAAFNPGSSADLHRLNTITEQFVAEYVNPQGSRRLYNVIDSATPLRDRFGFFTGAKPVPEVANPGFGRLIVPEVDYAVFQYRGDMKDIHHTVLNDICKTVSIAELPLKKAGIDFIVVYHDDYFETNQFYIYVPVSL